MDAESGQYIKSIYRKYMNKYKYQYINTRRQQLSKLLKLLHRIKSLYIKNTKSNNYQLTNTA